MSKQTDGTGFVMRYEISDPWDAAFFGYYHKDGRVTGRAWESRGSPKSVDEWLPQGLTVVHYDPDPTVNYIAWVNNSIFHGDKIWKEIALYYRSRVSSGKHHSYSSWVELCEIPVVWFYLREGDSLSLYRRTTLVGAVNFTDIITGKEGFSAFPPF